jgi:hypothetical protein
LAEVSRGDRKSKAKKLDGVSYSMEDLRTFALLEYETPSSFLI